MGNTCNLCMKKPVFTDVGTTIRKKGNLAKYTVAVQELGTLQKTFSCFEKETTRQELALEQEANSKTFRLYQTKTKDRRNSDVPVTKIDTETLSREQRKQNKLRRKARSRLVRRILEARRTQEKGLLKGDILQTFETKVNTNSPNELDDPGTWNRQQDIAVLLKEIVLKHSIFTVEGAAEKFVGSLTKIEMVKKVLEDINIKDITIQSDDESYQRLLEDLEPPGVGSGEWNVVVSGDSLKRKLRSDVKTSLCSGLKHLEKSYKFLKQKETNFNALEEAIKDLPKNPSVAALNRVATAAEKLWEVLGDFRKNRRFPANHNYFHAPQDLDIEKYIQNFLENFRGVSKKMANAVAVYHHGRKTRAELARGYDGYDGKTNMLHFENAVVDQELVEAVHKINKIDAIATLWKRLYDYHIALIQKHYSQEEQHQELVEAALLDAWSVVKASVTRWGKWTPLMGKETKDANKAKFEEFQMLIFESDVNRLEASIRSKSKHNFRKFKKNFSDYDFIQWMWKLGHGAQCFDPEATKSLYSDSAYVVINEEYWNYWKPDLKNHPEWDNQPNWFQELLKNWETYLNDLETYRSSDSKWKSLEQEYFANISRKKKELDSVTKLDNRDKELQKN